jgi:hypothetical protein
MASVYITSPNNLQPSPPCIFNPAAILFSTRDLYQHHQVIQPVFGPSTEPTHLPIAEPGAERHRRAKAKKLRLQLHVISRSSFVHT